MILAQRLVVCRPPESGGRLFVILWLDVPQSSAAHALAGHRGQFILGDIQPTALFGGEDRECAVPTGKRLELSADWPNRLVRAEVDLTAGRVQFFKLRRRDHANHPLLKAVKYQSPTKRFHK